MRIVPDLEGEAIERIVRSLDNQCAYTRTRSFDDSDYKRLVDLFRQFLKRGKSEQSR